MDRNLLANAGDTGLILGPCCGATKRMGPTLSPRSRAQELQLLKPVHSEPLLRNERSHCNEKPAHRNYRKTAQSNEHPLQLKINKFKKFFPASLDQNLSEQDHCGFLHLSVLGWQNCLSVTQRMSMNHKTDTP